MSPLADRPLVFVDVDGPLIPFGPRADGSPHRTTRDPGPVPQAIGEHPLLDRLDPDDGHRLLALGCELVWATSWMAEANDVIAPRIGLPALALVEWSDPDRVDGAAHWKTHDLIRWAAGRPFVWIDDEITDADRRLVAARHPGPALLHHVDASVGLTDADFLLIHRWLADR